MIQVMLVEDHVLVREGVRALLRDVPDVEIVAETGQGEEALALARRLRPDVVLLDIRLDRSSGIDVARALRRDLPDVKVLELTAHNYETYVRALFAIGVHGYLLKNVSGMELIAAVRAVCRGERVLSVEVAAQLATFKRFGITATWTLSNREREVLALVSQGDSNKEIGRELHLKETTVEWYLSNIMRKLGVRSRTEAIRVAVKRGIIVLED